MSEQTALTSYDWDLTDRLHKSLRIAGIRPGDMTEVLGVSRNTVGNYLGGRTQIKDGSLRSWAMRCGVPFEWLKTGVGTPTHGPEGPHTQGKPTLGCDTAAVESLESRRLRPIASEASRAA